MRVQGWYWQCEYKDCSKKWPANDVVPPTQCSKCKRRGWHTKNSGVAQSAELGPHKVVVAGSIPAPATIASVSELAAKYGLASASSLLVNPEAAKPKFYTVDDAFGQHSVAEIPICGFKWWEEGEQYECLMDAGHSIPLKHGRNGMVRRVDE